MLVAGVVDIGRGYSQTGVIVSAARQGARHAATNPTDIDTIKARTVEEAWGAGVVIDPATVTVTTPSGTGSGNRVNVSIAYQFTPYVGGVFGINQIRIVRDCSMVIF